MKKIETKEDIKLLVDVFYDKVRDDDLLATVFNEVIQDRWTVHLEKMYGFWQTVLLGQQAYKGHPFLPHMQLPITQKHFNRWLQLFQETVDMHFEGRIADEAKWRSAKMAEMFQQKIAYYQQSTSIPIK